MSKPIHSFLILSLLLTSSLCGFLSEPKTPRNLYEQKRRAGILLHITSLPSNYGIGTLGVEAFKFVDFLVKGKQQLWQMLPIQPTSSANSPYQALSTFAGNHYMIDLDLLVQDELLLKEEIEAINWGNNPKKVDFSILYTKRPEILQRAFLRFKKTTPGYKEFVNENKWWLDDYALFMALKEKYENKPWTSWPDELKFRDKETLRSMRKTLSNKIDFHYFLQFEFDKQWTKLRQYANSHGIQLIGDVPIYVPQDSADAWANPEIFKLDDKGNPVGVAGCPPDSFSPDGQLWGNPLYDWEAMKQNNFEWYVRRLRETGKKFDIIRIDHFRGIESYWHVPFGETTARNGWWAKGPGYDFVKALHEQLPNISFIAEDLGYLTPDVIELMKASGFPGMKILMFAFDTSESSVYLPHKYERNSVCYTGTHDNDTIMSWQNTMPREERAFVERYLGLAPGTDLAWPLIKAGLNSVSDTFIAQYQDYLALGNDARMNTPGIVDERNWVWRAIPCEFSDQLAHDMAGITCEAGRCN